MREFWKGLEKNRFVQLNENLIFCYVAEWGTYEKNPDYYYAVATPMPYEEKCYEIWGYSKDPIEAILNALKHMTEKLKENISKDSIKDFGLLEFAEFVKKDEPCYSSPDDVWTIYYTKEQKEEGYLGESFGMSIHIENNECFPMHI